MDHLVHLETSLLILPACACNAQVDPYKFYNSLPFSGLETSRDERGHVAPFSP